MKLLVDGDTDRVVGCHILGPDAAEIVQMGAIALKMGATKADFDTTVALHPSIAEELVNAFDTPQLVATTRPPDLPQPALIRVLTRDGRRRGPLAVTPDGSLLISGEGGSVDLWDGDTGAAVKTWQHGGNVIALEVAQDGSWVASSGQGVRIWDLAMKIERHVLDGPAGPADLLVIRDRGGRRAQVHDKAEVGFVEAHAERRCRDQRLDLVVQQILLGGAALGILDLARVRSHREA